MDSSGVKTTKILIGILVGIFILCEISAPFDLFARGGLATSEGIRIELLPIPEDMDPKAYEEKYFETEIDLSLQKIVFRLKEDLAVKQGPLKKGTVLVSHDGQLNFWGRGVLSGEFWRLLTGALLHGNPMHIFCNCFCLWQFFPWLIGEFGEKKAQITLWLGVLGGALLSGIKLDTFGVGISGGVFAVFGVYFFWLWQLKQHNKSAQLDKAWKSFLMWMGFNLFLGIAAPNISLLGHLGGLIVGLALAKFYLKPRVGYVY
jgi:membrane associated rhomboid family serine protease